MRICTYIYICSIHVYVYTHIYIYIFIHMWSMMVLSTAVPALTPLIAGEACVATCLDLTLSCDLGLDTPQRHSLPVVPPQIRTSYSVTAATGTLYYRANFGMKCHRPAPIQIISLPALVFIIRGLPMRRTSCTIERGASCWLS